MSEEQASESVEPSESVEEASSPSLDEIAKEFSVEEQAQTFNAKPEVETREQYNFVPDPVSDPEGWNQYNKAQAGSIDTLSQQFQQLNQKIQSYEQQLAQQSLNADVDAAVKKVNEKLDVDPDMAEVALRMEYDKNPSFKKIWDNRSRNPQAFEKALGAVADKYASKFSISRDPQLTQNQIAAKKSTQTMAKTPPPDQNSEWENLSEAEFERKWAEMKQGY